MPRILLIDDDERLAPPLATYLKRFDFELARAGRPSEGLARLRVERFDAAILDVMLPEMDGFELLREIRRGGAAMAELPVIMLTARGELTDRVVGLELGADDYLPKPFEPRELAARLHTVLRRSRSPVPGVAVAVAVGLDHLRFDGLAIDLARREVRRQGEPVELTGTEFELLTLLAREPRKVFSRDEILNRLRGHEADMATRAVDILVSRLRRKLEPLDCIKTLRNAGYAFAAAPEAGA
jgi:OmpR family response regulator RpaB